ncbi:MetQ/NlpA family ABC transporter substrate-binding protein [Candidatus Cetobacterium colombiensis]|uniref:Lipoprotein n=1 Tax=Candidatus Cetobacterium colombiensis TaxID=3073100 RepID=A0ABU4WC88_9FUSO|nr:MetQ/NlpA family ABC transporter substrate-binding protein [Candidatus Cetobacterium colombiensis]MDX8336171.1 MetQ/NlpA family ABC transporter substrate-binding protein [Candidatus Cetobacterium colombiensis]
MKRLKGLRGIIFILLSVIGFLGCGKSSEEPKVDGKKIVKLGINGDENVIWENVRDQLAKENIELKFINFADYIRPNLALQEKEIDINAFQTEIYFDNFKKEHKLSIINLGYTVLAPMGVYSKKLNDLSQLKDGATVAIPNDSANGGRALLLLQDAGLLTVNKDAGVFPRVKDIVENPKNLKIVELVATQIPRSIEDVDVAAINNGVAVQAGYSPLQDSIYIEDFKNERLKPYFNIIASRDDNQDKPEIKRVLEIYQTAENKKLIDEYYKGSSIAVF